LSQVAAIELVTAFAKLPIRGGRIIARCRVIFYGAFLVALPSLHFPPLEIFAQRRFQPIPSRILCTWRRFLSAVALIIRHGRPVVPLSCCPFGSIACSQTAVGRRRRGGQAANPEPGQPQPTAPGRLAAIWP